MTPDITLTDATDEEVEAALMGATKSPINFSYFWNTEIGGRVRKFQFAKSGIELPLRHPDKLAQQVRHELVELNECKRRLVRRVTESLMPA